MLANTPAHPDGAGCGCDAGSEVVNKAEGVSGNPERPLSKHPVRWFDGVVQFGEQELFSGPAFMSFSPKSESSNDKRLARYASRGPSTQTVRRNSGARGQYPHP